MKRAALAAAGILLALAARADFCDQSAQGAQNRNAMPNDEDRATFDRALVAYVARTVTTPNDAYALANDLLWKRSQKFVEQPRAIVYGRRTYMGALYGPRWNDEEVALWQSIAVSALEQAGAGYHAPQPRLADNAFSAAWEVMMARRLYVTYDCN